MNATLRFGQLLARTWRRTVERAVPGRRWLPADAGWKPLDAGGSISAVRARGQRIECRAGTVWLTEEGRLQDIILEPGQSYLVETNRHVLIHAFEDSQLRRVPASGSPAAHLEGIRHERSIAGAVRLAP